MTFALQIDLDIQSVKKVCMKAMYTTDINYRLVLTLNEKIGTKLIARFEREFYEDFEKKIEKYGSIGLF